jgi:teichuronic acid exporter
VSLGLIAADVAGRLIASAFLLRSISGMELSQVRNVSITELKSTAYKFREFPLITVFGGLVNSAGIVLTPIMIYAKFNAEISGQFGLVERAISLPIAMVIGAVSQVYMSNLGTAVRDDVEQIRAQFHSVLRMLVLIAFVPAIVAFAFAPALFTMIFGAKWQIAGELARIMIPAYFIIFVYGGVNMTIMILGRQFIQTSWEIFRLGCMAGLWIFVVTPQMNVETVVTMHAIVMGGVSLLFIVLAEYSVRKGPTKLALDHG